MNYNFFTDFVALTSIAGIEKSFSEKKKAEKSQVEKNTAEKKCECKCKNQQDFHKELTKEIGEFRLYLMSKMHSLNEVDTFLCNIEERLCAKIEKTDTENSEKVVYTKYKDNEGTLYYKCGNCRTLMKIMGDNILFCPECKINVLK